MSSQVIVANGYPEAANPTLVTVQVWADTTKLLPDGLSPDPAYVLPFNYPYDPASGVSVANFVAGIKADIQVKTAAFLAGSIPVTQISGLIGFTF